MSRPVRITPVPIPPPPPPLKARPRLGGGAAIALLLIGVLAYAGHIVVAGASDHSYDRHAVPAAQVRVTVGGTYLISTVDGPAGAVEIASLHCTIRPAGRITPDTLGVTPLSADSRATHAVASFVAPTSGLVAITCSGGAVGSLPVFVDDADDAGHDLGGVLLVFSVLLLLIGSGAGLGALYRRGLPPAATRAVSGVTDEPDC